MVSTAVTINLLTYPLLCIYDSVAVTSNEGADAFVRDDNDNDDAGPDNDKCADFNVHSLWIVTACGLRLGLR